MRYYGITDKGRVRATNQDAFAAVELRLKCTGGVSLLAVVCDGMGGANGGETASKCACECFVQYVRRQIEAFDEDLSQPKNIPFEKILSDGVKKANDEVLSIAKGNAELDGMGTTLVASLDVGGTLYAVSVGDSRLYAMDKQGLRQLSHDHSFVQSLVDSGAITKEEARTHPEKNVILRAVGASASINPETYVCAPVPDTLLLCSDGLSGMVKDEETEAILQENPSPEEAAKALLGAANEGGGADNITVIVVKNEKETERPRRTNERSR